MSEGTPVAVDPKRCEAMGFCVQLAPALFTLPGGAPPVSYTGPQELSGDEQDLAFEAEGLCPTQALQVRE